ncbi:MAG TPA: hypothetical protein VFC19_15915 [Candidatus Limnocylindrales bacterium]|nr:hypothetical protein [Candidatus Limnocylindrales bacterium]
MRIEQHLKATLRELAAEARGVDELARSAMIHGVRMRRRRRLAVATGAAALLIVALAPFALKRASSQEIVVGPSASASPSVREVSEVEPRRLAGGWMLVGMDNWVLNREANSYTRLRTDRSESQYLPSPTGNLAAMVSPDREANQDLIEFVTTAGAPLHAVRLRTNGVYQWSPGGDRLVTGAWAVADPRLGTGFGFAIVDARTGRVSSHRVDTLRFDCSMCTFAWSRDGSQVALGITNRRGEGSELFAGVQFFDARTGEPARAMPLRAMFSGPYSWSPNGRYVIAQTDGLKREFELVDTSSFESRPFPYDAVFVTDDVLLAVDASTIVAMRPDGTVVDRFELAGEFRDLGAAATFGPPS